VLPGALVGRVGWDQLHIDTQSADQHTESRSRRVRLAALDPTDLSLVEASHRGELLLSQVLSATLSTELARQREVQPERVQLGDRPWPFRQRLGFQLRDELIESRHASSMGYISYGAVEVEPAGTHTATVGAGLDARRRRLRPEGIIEGIKLSTTAHQA
jgi:hypothetical protein